VVLVEFKDDSGQLQLKYRFFGGAPGESLSLEGFKTAKHSKGNATGVKLERPAVKVVPVSRFERVSDIISLVDVLLGTSDRSSGRGTD
jgi:hypothetical protein